MTKAIVLIQPDDYIAAGRGVAVVADDHLVWLQETKKVENPPRLEPVLLIVPRADVTRVGYRRRISVLGIFVGAALIAAGLGLYAFFWELQRINLWFLLLGGAAILSGLAVFTVMLLGMRRRTLSFTCGDRVLTWTSAAMDFKATALRIVEICDWAERHGVEVHGFPTRQQLLQEALRRF